MIDKTREDYLRAVYHIEEEQNNSQINSIDLCKYLKVSKSSVSEMLRKLTKSRLIAHTSYKKIRLTPKGRQESSSVTKRHRIIESFLSEIIKLNPALIHEEAHKLEHAFSDDSISRINALLKNPNSCPHGKPIPKTIK